MNDVQIMLVQSSWLDIEPMKDQIGELFYRRLFELDPDAASLFVGDIKMQAQKLMTMIGMAVTMLDNPDGMAPAMDVMSRRHTESGVKRAHVAPFGDALIWAIGQGLGPAFTDEIRDAWTVLYQDLSGMMRLE